MHYAKNIHEVFILIYNYYCWIIVSNSINANCNDLIVCSADVFMKLMLIYYSFISGTAIV